MKVRDISMELHDGSEVGWGWGEVRGCLWIRNHHIHTHIKKVYNYF